MGKSETTKYFIHAKFEAEGIVEKHDVVGAVFGQTEGLLGEDLELRELEKAGKIDRMEIDIETENGSSQGELTIGSSLDRVETAVIAASLEAISRVGPSEAEFQVDAVEDIRAKKRRKIVERAKELLSESFEAPKTHEMLKEVQKEETGGRVESYSGLPSGNRIDDSESIIVVEGRADVTNLLKNGKENVIAVEGTSVPEKIIELSKQKTVTAFTDSDRGGELLLKELSQVAEIDYVARPPEGKSVEELSEGEIEKALEKRYPLETVEGALQAKEGEIVLIGKDWEEKIDSEKLEEKLEENARKKEKISEIAVDKADQEILDIASSEKIEKVIAKKEGEVVKKPLGVELITEYKNEN